MATDRIVDVDIAERMEQSFLDYSMSVIVGRALPDARDGLKPVQRRILYAMWEAGLRPDRPYRKCASAVGDVMKKYHPHGDSSIYDALVRMAQPFSMRVPLVDGHGNFGSVDGDSAAAMRYTEARLSPAAMQLLAGIDEGTVDFTPNYDGDEAEPAVLPGRWPNLLVNGASGIAVGMATNIPPHNLGEVVEACLHLIKRPEATLHDLLRFVPAPDFPTGGRILATDGIREAYATGRGAITVEAIATTETRAGGLPRIVVTEIPYQVNKSALLERMADLVKDRKVTAIRDLRDESSRDGMRVVIELKRGEEPGPVLARLYELTDLRTRFSVNLVALVDGQPRTLGLVEALTHYLGHQRQVLTRRTTFRRDRAAARAHILAGLLVALDHVDQVIAIIRGSQTPDEARAQLIARFGLDEVQATAILDLQLRRLVALERHKIAEEHRELLAVVAALEAILADPAKLNALLARELRELRRELATPRRSRLAGDTDGETAQLDAQPVGVTVTAGGYVRSVPLRRATPSHNQPRDPLVAALRATTGDTLLLVDADGGGARIDLADVPVTTVRQRGVRAGQAAPLVGAVLLREDVGAVVTLSARGLLKRTPVEEYLAGRAGALVAAGVRDDDAIVAVTTCTESDDLLLAHDGGLVLRTSAAQVRASGRGTVGVAGMSVPDGRWVVSLSVGPGGEAAEAEVVTLGRDGEGKRTPLDEYPRQGRGGKGVLAGATDRLAWCGVADALHVPTREGWQVVQVAELAQGRRTAGGANVCPGVTGRVVAHGSGLLYAADGDVRKDRRGAGS